MLGCIIYKCLDLSLFNKNLKTRIYELRSGFCVAMTLIMKNDILIKQLNSIRYAETN